MIKRILGIIIVLALIGWAALSFIFKDGGKANEPAIDEVPFVVQTHSRQYLVSYYEEINGVVIIDNYYEMAESGKKWIYNDRMLVLDEAFGEVKVTRRTME